MSWGPTIYVQFDDEAAARGVATGLGVEFPEDGSIPTGNGNYALAAPIDTPWIAPPVFDWSTRPPVEVSAGTRDTGYWAMIRLNQDWPGYADTVAALEPYTRTPAHPPTDWA